MHDPMDKDDEVWIEISDAEGHKAALRHLAKIEDRGHVYHVLGALQEDEQRGSLLIVREDTTGDGATEHVVIREENEIERVVALFAMRVIADHLEEDDEENAPDDASAMEATCGCTHGPMDFCYCGIPEFLQ